MRVFPRMFLPKYNLPLPLPVTFNDTRATILNRTRSALEILVGREAALVQTVHQSMEELASHLFIERYDLQINYKSYFESCAPASCQVRLKPSALTFTGIVLGVIGGIKGGLDLAFLLIFEAIVWYLLFRSARKAKREAALNAANIPTSTM